MPKAAAAAAQEPGAVASMTGFARVEGETDGVTWSWEIKSVNGKALDLRLRLPPGYDALELPLRALLGERLRRGSVSANLGIIRQASGANLRVNRAALEQVLALARELQRDVGATPPSTDGLLALKGVLESGEDDVLDPMVRSRREAALLAGCRRAIDELGAMRRAEGARLADVLRERLDEITELVVAAERTAALQPDAVRARLRSLVDALKDAVPGIAEERLAQEAALLVAKADVREELDRLGAHIAAARELLAEGDRKSVV